MKGMRKLLVTGASGLLGNWTVALAESNCLVTPTDIIEPLHPNALKTDASGIYHLFRKLRPKTVIHTASETNVDKYKTERERVWNVVCKITPNSGI